MVHEFKRPGRASFRLVQGQRDKLKTIKTVKNKQNKRMQAVWARQVISPIPIV